MARTNQEAVTAFGEVLHSANVSGSYNSQNNRMSVNDARRAWLFADTLRGAFANGVLYTLVESARDNALDVYEYLKHLLTEMPNNPYQEDPSVIDRFLPWSEELSEQCYLKTRHKKCLKQ